eukprot:2197230-Rhodomonas_salina.3
MVLSIVHDIVDEVVDRYPFPRAPTSLLCAARYWPSVRWYVMPGTERTRVCAARYWPGVQWCATPHRVLRR